MLAYMEKLHVINEYVTVTAALFVFLGPIWLFFYWLCIKMGVTVGELLGLFLAYYAGKVMERGRVKKP